MKLSSLLTWGAIVASCCSLWSQDTLKDHPLKYRASEGSTDITGGEIWNLQGIKLGTIKYITADLEHARLVEVVVQSSKRMTSVPPRALIFDTNAKHTISLDVSKKRFDAAPTFNGPSLSLSTKEERLAEINRYYGLDPWFYLPGQKETKDAQILPLGHVERTDRILNMPVTNTRGSYMGKVMALMYDLPLGQIRHVVIVNKDNAIPSSIIQARALHFNAANTGLVMNDTKAELSREPHLRWLNGGHATFQEESYVNRDVEADDGLHSKQNEQSGEVKYAAPMEEGANFRDELKTIRIKQAIQADASLSQTAKNIEVVTLNAQTTLRGNVKTLAGKQRIGEIAAKIGRPENVSNLLKVMAPSSGPSLLVRPTALSQ